MKRIELLLIIDSNRIGPLYRGQDGMGGSVANAA
jgi:hypothetical protein